MPHYIVKWPDRGPGSPQGKAYMHSKHPLGKHYPNPVTPSQATRKAANAARRNSSSKTS